uniref:Uncharacterized protein n=1 Tax=Glossina brevipalpis TaxID=37001 RepID=A0A1A9X0G8_9MUSC
MDLSKTLGSISAYFFRKPAYRRPNIGDDLRQIVQSEDFENKTKATAPFLVAGILAWPIYWIYRGTEWHKYHVLSGQNHGAADTYDRYYVFLKIKLINYTYTKD